MRLDDQRQRRVNHIASGAFLVVALFVGVAFWPRMERRMAPCTSPQVLSGILGSRVVCRGAIAQSVRSLCRLSGPPLGLHVETRLGPLGCGAQARRIDPLIRWRLAMKLDANTAPYEVLVRLHGLGPVLARRLIAQRPFTRWAELMKVKGVGPKRLRSWAPSLEVVPPVKASFSLRRRVP